MNNMDVYTGIFKRYGLEFFNVQISQIMFLILADLQLSCVIKKYYVIPLDINKSCLLPLTVAEILESTNNYQ